MEIEIAKKSAFLYNFLLPQGERKKYIHLALLFLRPDYTNIANEKLCFSPLFFPFFSSPPVLFPLLSREQ